MSHGGACGGRAGSGGGGILRLAAGVLIDGDVDDTEAVLGCVGVNWWRRGWWWTSKVLEFGEKRRSGTVLVDDNDLAVVNSLVDASGDGRRADALAIWCCRAVGYGGHPCMSTAPY
jgi:hypothetical protein